MGLDGQCGIFDELIISVRTVHVPTGYNYGMSTGTYHVRYSLLALRKMYSGTGTLVPCAPYFRTEQAPDDVRGG